MEPTEINSVCSYTLIDFANNTWLLYIVSVGRRDTLYLYIVSCIY